MLTHASPDRLIGARTVTRATAPPSTPPGTPPSTPPGNPPASHPGRPAGARRAAGIAAARRLWPCVRVLGGLGILAFLVWRVGAGGLLAGLRTIDPGILLAAVAIGLLTTLLSAWRWCLIARGLGTPLPLGRATADYYRALFLNAVLPGGILGDVHRAVRHGRDIGDVGLGVRAVALERVAGQVILVAAAVTILVALPSPLPAPPGLTGLAVVGLAVVGLMLAGLAIAALVSAAHRGRPAGSRWDRTIRTGTAAVRDGLLARGVWPGVVGSSVAVLAGYLATFLLAARAAGVTAPLLQVLPLVLLALLAMALPVNVGGWGPREGASAWAFGAAGLGATQGLTVAVVYGLAVFVASLPGAAVLAARWLSRRQGPPLRPAGKGLLGKARR